MCIDIANNNVNMRLSGAKKSTSYSIKGLLKQLFKPRRSAAAEDVLITQNVENAKKMESLESLESIDNQLNADIESYENDANERISISCELENCEFADISAVPVHFVRTVHGTFFWTAVSDIPVDNDLIEPLYCNTSNQIAVLSAIHDRWVQA